MPMPKLRPLWPYYRPYLGLLVGGVACILAMSWIGLVAPLIIGRAIDRLLAGEVSTSGLATYAGLLVGVTAARGVFHFLQRYLLVSMSRNIEVDLRRDFYLRLQTLHAGFFAERPTGDLMARATNDLEAVRKLSGPAIMYIGNTVFTALGALYLMVGIDLGLTALALGTLPLVAVITRVFGRKIHLLFQGVQESFSDLTTKVQENLAGVRVVRAYVQEAPEQAAFRAINVDHLERQRRLILWNAAFQPMIQAVVGFGFAGVLGYGGWLILEGAITVGELVVFQLFLNRLVWPMVAIGWVVNLAQQAAASMERIRQILDEEPAIRDHPPLIDRAQVNGALALRELTFRYTSDAAPVLENVSFEVAAGETLAIVGRTGAGKSTLLSLVPRLLDPPAGALAVDGVDIHHWPLATLRSEIAVVPQETFLFSTTVGENIAFGRPEASAAEILRAASLAGLDNDLEGLPRGLDTLVGERGLTLSGGQKQRVALARAILRAPRILLLDDCLSAVDAHTEEEILRNLRTVFPGRTVWMASHRIAAARLCDRSVVLVDGRVEAIGTHDELIARPGLYRDLYRRQVLEEELDAVGAGAAASVAP